MAGRTRARRKSSGDGGARLETMVRELAGRVAALEGRERPRQPARKPASPPVSSNVVELLRGRRGEPWESGELRGSVLYAGAVRVGEREYLWEVERPVPVLLEHRPEIVAAILSALASPQRLMLVRALVAGPRSSHDLQAALGLSSAGPLYHHLKELVAAGLVEQRDRAAYQITPRHLVALLAILSAAVDVAAGRPVDDGE